MRDEKKIIAYRQGWGGLAPFGLSACDRRQHIYVVGKSGTGKSTLLKNLIVQDIQAGAGVALIDPHGDLAQELLDFIPPHRTEHVVYFNPADREFPIGLNLFHAVSPDSRHLVTSGIVAAFKGIWRDSWGPRLEYILYSAVAALLDVENGTLLGVQRMLVDGNFRKWVVGQVKDVAVRSFWENEFENYDVRLRSEIISPVQNKIGQLLMAAPLRNILGQVRSKIDPRFMIDNKRIFIANLSKGKLGEDKANLLGSFLVTQFQLAAMSRSDMPEEKRRDFHLYIDEFHNFTTDSFASILSEARKYRLCLTLSHQYTSQVQPSVRDAIFGNVGTTITFRVGEADADILEKEFGRSYAASHFTNLSNYEVCVKSVVDGEQREPFTARTLPATEQRYGRRENLIQRSREKYATRRIVIEEKIKRWMSG